MPNATVSADIEGKREKWVQAVKNAPSYNTTIGVTLGIEAPNTPFRPSDYTCELYDLLALNAHSVTGKFRKAGGNVDSINLYGRKGTNADLTPLAISPPRRLRPACPWAGPRPKPGNSRPGPCAGTRNSACPA